MSLAQYPIVKLKNASNPSGATAFMNYVLSSAGQQVLKKYGFMPRASQHVRHSRGSSAQSRRADPEGRSGGAVLRAAPPGLVIRAPLVVG